MILSFLAENVRKQKQMSNQGDLRKGVLGVEASLV